MAKKSAILEKSISQYGLIISKLPSIERKGASTPYTSMNGNMYSMMRNDGALGIRLSKEDRDYFMEKYQAIPFENYGSMIKEYVEVPANVLLDTDTMIHFMKLSYEYAKTLKHKATKKPEKKSTSIQDKKVTDLAEEKYKNGQIKANIQGTILTIYFEDGTIKAQGRIENHKMFGKWLFNKKSGSLWQTGNFKDDVKNGEFIRYDSKGEVAYHVEFSNGKVIKKFV